MTQINLTKLDVLDALDEIKIGVGYRLSNGESIHSVPADIETLKDVEVVYETHPGWKTDITACRTWEELPENARNYVERIQELCGIHCKWIGVGPGRDALIVKPE